MSKQLLCIDLMVVIVKLWLESSLPLAGIQNWLLLVVSAENDFKYATSSHEQSATANKCSTSLVTVTYCKSLAKADGTVSEPKRVWKSTPRKDKT